MTKFILLNPDFSSPLVRIADYVFVLEMPENEWNRHLLIPERERVLEEVSTPGVYIVQNPSFRTSEARFYHSLFSQVPREAEHVLITKDFQRGPDFLECIQHTETFLASSHPFDVLDLDGWLTVTMAENTNPTLFRMGAGLGASRATLYSRSGREIIMGLPQDVPVGRHQWIAAFYEYFCIRPSLVDHPFSFPIPLSIEWKMEPWHEQCLLLAYLSSLPRRQQPILTKNQSLRWVIPQDWTPVDVFSHLAEILQYVGPFTLTNFSERFPDADETWQPLLKKTLCPLLGAKKVRLVDNAGPGETDVFYIEREDSPSMKKYIRQLVNDLSHQEWRGILYLMGILLQSHTQSFIVSTIETEDNFEFNLQPLQHFRFFQQETFYQSLLSKLWEGNAKQIFYLLQQQIQS